MLCRRQEVMIIVGRLTRVKYRNVSFKDHIFLARSIRWLYEESFEDIPMIPVIFSYSARAPPPSFSVYDVSQVWVWESICPNCQIISINTCKIYLFEFAKYICPNWPNVFVQIAKLISIELCKIYLSEFAKYICPN